MGEDSGQLPYVRDTYHSPLAIETERIRYTDVYVSPIAVLLCSGLVGSSFFADADAVVDTVMLGLRRPEG
jgi:hypothetical protein